MQKSLFFTAYLLCVFLSVHCVFGQTEEVDKVVAVVNGEIITEYELNQYFQPVKDKILAMNASLIEEKEALEENRKKILNRLIDQKLSDQEIKKINLEVSDADVERTIESFKKNNRLTEEELIEALKSQNLTFEEYKDRLRHSIERNNLVNYQVKSKIVITEEDIKAYYEEHTEIYKDELKYHIRNILLKKPLSENETQIKKIRMKMENIVSELNNGLPFAEAAKKYTESGLAESGGDLGWYKPETLSPQIKDALTGLKDGEITPILDTDKGFQLFFLEEINVTKKKTLVEAKDEIEKILYDQIVDEKYKEWLKTMRTESHIVIKD